MIFPAISIFIDIEIESIIILIFASILIQNKINIEHIWILFFDVWQICFLYFGYWFSSFSIQQKKQFIAAEFQTCCCMWHNLFDWFVVFYFFVSCLYHNLKIFGVLDKGAKRLCSNRLLSNVNTWMVLLYFVIGCAVFRSCKHCLQNLQAACFLLNSKHNINRKPEDICSTCFIVCLEWRGNNKLTR